MPPLHLRCGDDILPTLEALGLPGEFRRWADPLCEGPLRAWPDEGARRAERSTWLAARYGGDPRDVLAGLEAEDVSLASAARADEVVLWFEADLFDQAILVYLLDRLADVAPERTSLICIGSHPEVTGFVGLGQLGPAQLEALYPARVPVSPAQFAVARTTWEALQGGDPERLWNLAGTGTPELPFLADALRRYLAELPSVRTGLGLTESMGLQAFLAGADTPFHAFPAVQRFENRPWQGDTMFYALVRLLASGPMPLLRARGKMPPAGDRAFEQVRFEVTDHGRAVLAGREDWCRLSGASWWHGSILVEAPRPRWRWDERAERPVQSD